MYRAVSDTFCTELLQSLLSEIDFLALAAAFGWRLCVCVCVYVYMYLAVVHATIVRELLHSAQLYWCWSESVWYHICGVRCVRVSVVEFMCFTLLTVQ